MFEANAISPASTLRLKILYAWTTMKPTNYVGRHYPFHYVSLVGIRQVDQDQ